MADLRDTVDGINEKAWARAMDSPSYRVHCYLNDAWDHGMCGLTASEALKMGESWTKTGYNNIAHIMLEGTDKGLYICRPDDERREGYLPSFRSRKAHMVRKLDRAGEV